MIIHKNEAIEYNGRLLVRIVLDKDINESDSSVVTSAVFGASECERFRLSFLSEVCRCVDFNRFTQVILNGIDVEPTDSHIWISSLSKAMEYADFPKLVLILDKNSLERTFVKLPKYCSEERLANVRKTYPTVLEDAEGLWCSRLPANEGRMGRGNYEESYAYWIPKNAKQALVGMIVIESSKYNGDENWQKIKALFLS